MKRNDKEKRFQKQLILKFSLILNYSFKLLLKIPELAEMGLDIEKTNMKRYRKQYTQLPKSDATAANDEISAYVQHAKGCVNLMVRTKVQNILLQNAGIFIGYSCMLLLAIYSKYITI